MMNWITLIHLSVNIIFWMHTAGTANGNTESPPWITLSGCFNYSINNATSNIQKNEPTLCFENCTSSQSVALKNMSCICNPLYTPSGILINSRCNLPCPGKSEVFCGSEDSDNELMSVYTRDTTLLDGINGSYGYGYVDISGINKVIHASDSNTSLQHGFLCYKDFDSQYISDKSRLMTWEDALTQCNRRSARLLTASDILTCPTGSAYDGTYWIGIYREKPDITTLTTTTSTSTTATSTSTSTSTTATSTSFTSSKPTISFITTTGLRPSQNSDTPVIEQTSKASSSVGIKAVAVAVPVVAFLVVLGSILFCKKRKLLCFKERQQSGKMDESNNASPQEIPELISTMTSSSVPPGSTRAPFQIIAKTDEIKNNSPPEIPYMNPRIDVKVSSSAPSGSNQATFEGHRENIRPIVSGQTDIQEGHYAGSNAEHYDREKDISTPNHLEGRSVKPENAFDLDDGINSSLSKRKKGKKKRRSKKNKKNYMVRAANENSEIDGNTDNHAMLDRYTNDDHSVPNERTENPNDESRYDERKRTEKKKKQRDYSKEEQKNTSSKPFAALDPNIQFNRPATASDVHAIVPTVQEKIATYINGSDEVHNELNTSNSESRIEETKKHKRSEKRKKRKKSALFDVPADHPVVEGQTDINNLGFRIN